MIFKNTRSRFVLGLVVVGCLSVAVAAPSRVSSQSDIGKMWRTGGVTAAQTPVSGQPFKTAVSFSTSKKSAQVWRAQSGMNPKVALRQGESLMATFFVRSAKPATGGQIIFSVEGGPKYERSAWKEIKTGSSWKKVSVPFKAKGSYAPGKWQATFKMGSMAQTVQIANFQLMKVA